MNNRKITRLPTHFWVITVIALIWNVIGVVAYVMEVSMTEEAMATLPEAHQALYAAQPTWVTGAFAIAVFAGVAGCLLLMIRARAATPVLITSLVAAIAQVFYVLVASDTLAVLGPSSATLPALVIVIAVGLVWFSMRAGKLGWFD